MVRAGKTRYPRFLFGLPLAAGEIPIFVYHDVDPEDFRRDLTFLRENGYRTATPDEVVNRPRGSPRDEGRSVLLTFDDAVRNFWDVTFPLLREFGARATLFAPTFWIEEPAGPHREGEPSCGVEPGLFMTWEHLRACRASGLVDVQSHAHRHALVYTGARLVDFASPATLARHHLYDWPMRRAEGGDVLGRPPLGTPIYESTPLLSADRRLIEDAGVSNACVEHAAARGGVEWFGAGGWRRELLDVHERATRRGHEPSPMAPGAFRSLVDSEITLSRERFNSELGVAPRYLAYPWMLGSARTIEIAARAGIAGVFGVGIDFGRIRRMNGPLPAFGRVKGEWLRFLPGHGRSSLAAALPRKLAGFFRDQHLAH